MRQYIRGYLCLISLVCIINSICLDVKATEVDYSQVQVQQMPVDLSYYNLMLNLLNELELAAIDYINASHIEGSTYNKYGYTKEMLVVSYIRSMRYNDNEWNTLCGYVDTDFEIFAQTTHPAVNTIRNIVVNIQTPAGDYIDIFHLFASINMIYSDYEILGTWGGDLVELMSDIQNYDTNLYGEIPETDNLYDEYRLKAERIFLKESSQFNIVDLASDIDAINIVNYKEKYNTSLSNAILNYYNNISGDASLRIKTFVDNKYSFTDFTEKRIINSMSYAFEQEPMMLLLMLKFNIESSNKDLISAAIDIFSHYIYEMYPDVKISKITITNDEELSIESKPVKIRYNVEPRYNVKNKNIKIESSDKSVVRIINNKIKPLSIGSSTIKVYCNSEQSISDNITEAVGDEIVISVYSASDYEKVRKEKYESKFNYNDNNDDADNDDADNDTAEQIYNEQYKTEVYTDRRKNKSSYSNENFLKDESDISSKKEETAVEKDENITEEIVYNTDEIREDPSNGPMSNTERLSIEQNKNNKTDYKTLIAILSIMIALTITIILLLKIRKRR